MWEDSMQELTNILLASSGKSAGASTKDAVNGVENEAFSLALSEANSHIESRVNARTAEKTAKTDETLVQIEERSKPDAEALPVDRLEVDDGDVALIFAQISLASGMQQRQQQTQSGEFLPESDALDAQVESLVTIDPEQYGAAREIGSDDESLLNSGGNASDEAMANNPFEDASPVVKFRGERVDFVALADATGLSLAQLADLTLEELRQVIATQGADVQQQADEATFTGQVSESGKGNLGLRGAAQTTNGAQAMTDGTLLPGAKLTQNQGMAVTEEMTADLDSLSRRAAGRETSPGIAFVAAQLQDTPALAKAVNAATASLVAQASASTQTVQSESLAGANADMGSTMSEAEALVLLRDARLSMGVAGEGVKEAHLFADTAQGAPDLKSLTSINGLHGAGTQRGDMPQFQLSLRQELTQQYQMQDMIQRFAPVMQQQLITMVSKGIQQAEIRLDPPELGQMMIRIQVQGDQTQVHFQVAQHQTRDLLDQALPRLREMLAAQGMQLADGQVAHDGAGREGKAREQQTFPGFSAEDLDDFTAEEPKLTANMTTSYPSGIDYYA
jgi:flagellar hook-length control protein FliK